MIKQVYISNPKNFTEKPHHLISTFGKVVGYKLTHEKIRNIPTYK